MKLFYLLRHQDVNGQSGTGVVAEGVIFDSGRCAMTWLSEIQTVTVFDSIVEIGKLHSHEGRTEVIVENKDERFKECRKMVRKIKSDKKKAAKS